MSNHNVLVKSFWANEQTITAKEPFTIEPVKANGFYHFKKEDIGLDCYVEPGNLHRAEKFVMLELAFLWREYALEKDDRLDLEALMVKRALNEQFMEA